MNKAMIQTAVIALAAYAAIAAVQSKYKIPVVGAYLPGAK